MVIYDTEMKITLQMFRISVTYIICIIFARKHKSYYFTRRPIRKKDMKLIKRISGRGYTSNTRNLLQG
jgi:hypothetical protein